MKTRIIFVISFMLIFALNSYGTNGELIRKPSELDDEQIKIFEKIVKNYPDIPYSKNIILFYDDEQAVTLYVEMDFKKDKQGYIGKYKNYAISFVPSDIEKSIKYKADMDNGITREGLIFIEGKSIIRVENECKLKKCTTKIYNNGKIVYPKN